MSLPDEPYPTYQLDRRNERAAAWLRLIAAVLVTLCAIWVLATGPTWRATAIAVGGLFVAAAWAVQFVRARARLREASAYRLAIEPEGLTMQEGARSERVEWRDVTAIEIDEEKLVVRVVRSGADPLSIEPRYQGVGLQEIERALRGAWERQPHR